jgi:hypothetical protein
LRDPERRGALGRAAANQELVLTVSELLVRARARVRVRVSVRVRVRVRVRPRLAVLAVVAEAPLPPCAQLGLVRHRCSRCGR